jgi:chemotaxis protein histidine kinase CheA
MFEAAMSTFFEEASENLDLMEQSLLSLEQQSLTDPVDDLNALFRLYIPSRDLRGYLASTRS